MTTILDDETFTIPCPPIISANTWRKAQEIREKNKNPVRHIKEDYLCVGLVYCACGWKCHAKARRANANRGYYNVTGRYVCPRRQNTPEALPENCAFSTSSTKVDDYVWNFVKRVCGNPEVLKAAVDRKLAVLQEKQADLEAETRQLARKLDGLAMERQWVITQARKGTITEDDMEMQLVALQFQELGYRKELEEHQAAAIVREQAQALREWADQYLTEINAGIEALEIDVETLSSAERSALAVELEAARYAKKYPHDELARLRWAILEEKRRIVRTLVEKVVGARLPNRRRKITPILAFQIPLQSPGTEEGDRLRSKSEYRNPGD